MSTRIEWSHVGSADLSLVGPGEVTDAYGTSNDGPALAIFTGSDGAVVEADTWDQLASALLALSFQAGKRAHGAE